MSKKQRLVLQFYAAIVATMMLFPPCQLTKGLLDTSGNGGMRFIARTEAAGFKFIGHVGTTPGVGSVSSSISVDPRILLLEFLAVTLVGGAVYAALRESGAGRVSAARDDLPPAR
jgi:hypothetical protein